MGCLRDSAFTLHLPSGIIIQPFLSSLKGCWWSEAQAVWPFLPARRLPGKDKEKKKKKKKKKIIKKNKK